MMSDKCLFQPEEINDESHSGEEADRSPRSGGGRGFEHIELEIKLEMGLWEWVHSFYKILAVHYCGLQPTIKRLRREKCSQNKPSTMRY